MSNLPKCPQYNSEYTDEDSSPTTQTYWVYVLLCVNNSYYTGYTNNVTKRYKSHVTGSGKCKYTRSFKPVSMVQCWKITGNKARAMQLERAIKKLSRTDKEELIANPGLLSSHACPDTLLVRSLNSQFSV